MNNRFYLYLHEDGMWILKDWYEEKIHRFRTRKEATEYQAYLNSLESKR